uniref:Uncharacterized protein n=1 Tax=Anguilla anguilla TaxID=7936 RepID=A0A0E9UR03_ANGAN
MLLPSQGSEVVINLSVVLCRSQNIKTKLK